MRYSVRKTLENMISADAVQALYLYIRRRPKIIVYHDVFKDKSGATLPWFVSMENFEKQLAYLKRHYVNLPLSDLIHAAGSGRPIPRNGITITFDDGYENNYKYAAPLLRKYGFTATFFVCPDFADMAQNGVKPVFWWYIIYCVMNEKNRDDFILIFNKHGVDLSGYGDIMSLRYQISRFLEAAPGEIGESIIVDLKDRFADDIRKMDFPKMMNWDQLKILKSLGMDIGSHTMSHIAVSRLPRERFNDQITMSKQILEEKLQDKIEAFAYPYGREAHYSRESLKAVKEAGYKCALLTLENGGSGEKDSFCFNRTAIEGDDDIRAFKLKASGIHDDINSIVECIKPRPVKEMNITFIYSVQEAESLYKPLRSQEQIQFGISYISSMLKEHGYKTKLVVLSRAFGMRNNRKILDRHIKSFGPQLICFTAVSSEYGFIASIAKYLKGRHSGIYFLIGGAHVSLNPEGILQDDFDALCIGEGEYPALELVNCLERKRRPSAIPNLWIKDGERIEKNSPRAFLKDLDSLPYPDREMWQEWIMEKPDSMHAVLLSRGCPFECTYCSNHALKRLADGSYVRLRSHESIIGELKGIAESFPDSRNIYLETETFYIDKRWAIELCSKLKDFNMSLDKPLTFGVNLRITTDVDYERLFEACEKSSFRFINIGLESGSERVRREILKRDYLNSNIIRTVNQAKKYNLKVCFYNMIGIPGEKIDDFKETLKMNRLCLPDWVMTSIFYPYPGTDLHSLCLSQGLINKISDAAIERTTAVLDLPGFSSAEIQKSYEWFCYDVYKGHKPGIKLLLVVFITKLRRWPKLFQIYQALARSGPYGRLRSFAQKISDSRDRKAELIK